MVTDGKQKKDVYSGHFYSILCWRFQPGQVSRGKRWHLDKGDKSSEIFLIVDIIIIYKENPK